jgi:hypothetical protein
VSGRCEREGSGRELCHTTHNVYLDHLSTSYVLNHAIDTHHIPCEVVYGGGVVVWVACGGVVTYGSVYEYQC